MAYSALYISGEILKQAKEKNVAISNMSMQKLLFIANGAYLAKTGEPLIVEPIEVWPYGPVIANVYHEFKDYGNNPITRMPLIFNIYGNFTEIEAAAIDFALQIAQRLDAIQLSNWTHLPDAPWTKAKEQNLRIIPNELIATYFKRFLKE